MNHTHCINKRYLILVIPEWPHDFPYFLQFRPQFCSKKLMIWATVTSRSCLWWLYRTLSSAAKNIINLVLILTIWWCPYLKSFLVVLEKDVCSGQCILFAKLSYPLPCFTLYSKAKLACYSKYLLSSYFWIPSPMMKRTSFLVLVLEGLVGLHRTIWFKLFQC